MLAKILFLTFLAIFANPTQSVPCGAAAGMDIYLVRNIKNYVIPYVIQEINALRLPRIDYNGGYVENVLINMNLQSLDSIQFSFDPT